LLAGYLAYQQWTIGRLIGSPSEYLMAAIGNAGSAIVTAYFAARLLMKPTRGILGTSAVWATLSVAWGIYQIANGVTGKVFVLSILAAGAAGVLSLVARQSVAAKPMPPGAPRVALGTPVVSVGATVAESPSGRANRTSPVLILLVLLSGALAIGVVGFALTGGRLGVGSTSPTGTVQATSQSATVSTGCATQLQPLYDALTAVDGRLGVGMNFGDFSKAVGYANVAYRRIDFATLDATCVTAAGVPLENALNSYVEAYNAWNKCMQSTKCDDAVNTATLQVIWSGATSQLDTVKAAWP
jgi:hypothetical protein